jgi:hypothetical protein
MMNVQRVLFRALNRALGRFDLKLDKIGRDFDARLDQPEQLARIFRGIGCVADQWFSEQKLFPVRNQFSSADLLSAFYHEFLASPFRTKFGGSRFNNLVWLHLIAKAMNPSIVIDSGTFMGASAWAFSLAVPEAVVLSFDIDLSRITHRAKGVRFVEYDWTKYDWRLMDLADALIYFDDHLDQARRLIEASEHGIGLAIFDDDFPVTSFAGMANGGSALPKIEFILDDDLRTQSEISWIDRGVRYSVPIKHDYWDRARSLIAETERLPDTSSITGIHQTPYRVVKVRPSGQSV